MFKVPITPGQLIGDVLEGYHRGCLDGSDLAAWAENLIYAGFDSDSITEALGSNDLHWQEVPKLFISICRDIGFELDASVDLESLKKHAMIEEYRHGYRQGAELFQRFDDLRKSAGFLEAIHFRLSEDNPDGTNYSGYYGDKSQLHGTELESQARKALEKMGVSRLNREEKK